MKKLNIEEAARKVVESGEGMSRNIWLAGLGVYSRSMDEAQQINTKASALFDELVERGREVEDVARKRIEKTRDATTGEVDDKVNDIIYRISGIDRDKLEKMDAKIDKLAETVALLVEQ
jgi:poly(hydroxyalkanoate) granule-associated protein